MKQFIANNTSNVLFYFFLFVFFFVFCFLFIFIFFIFFFVVVVENFPLHYFVENRETKT